MEDEVRLIGSAIPDHEVERLLTVGARGVDLTVGREGGTDPEGIPGAVRVPRTAVGLDPEWRRLGGERVGHRDLASAIEHEGVGVVKARPPDPDILRRSIDGRCDLGCRRGSAELDELAVGRVAQIDVSGVHVATVRDGLAFVNGLDSDSLSTCASPV